MNRLKQDKSFDSIWHVIKIDQSWSCFCKWAQSVILTEISWLKYSEKLENSRSDGWSWKVFVNAGLLRHRIVW